MQGDDANRNNNSGSAAGEAGTTTKEIVNAPQKAGKLTITHKILICGFTAVTVVASVAVYLLLKKDEAPPVVVNSGPAIGVMDEENVEDLYAEMADRAAQGMFETHMNTVWVFPDGSSPSSNAIIGNAEANKLPFYFDIVLETGETVYTSDLIPVGSRLKELKLDTPLPAGTYAASCMYHLVKEDGTSDSNVGMAVTLNIME